MPITIRPETPYDLPAIYHVHERAFPSDAEARLVDALRAGGYLRLSLVAVEGELVVGQVAFSALTIHTPTGPLAALSLAPVAVLPERQRQGIGAQLVSRGLEECRALGHRAVIVLGDPDYYRRFGFSTEMARPLASPYAGPYWMAIELVAGALAGVTGEVEYSPPFAGV